MKYTYVHGARRYALVVRMCKHECVMCVGLFIIVDGCVCVCGRMCARVYHVFVCTMCCIVHRAYVYVCACGMVTISPVVAVITAA